MSKSILRRFAVLIMRPQWTLNSSRERGTIFAWTFEQLCQDLTNCATVYYANIFYLQLIIPLIATNRHTLSFPWSLWASPRLKFAFNENGITVLRNNANGKNAKPRLINEDLFCLSEWMTSNDSSYSISASKYEKAQSSKRNCFIFMNGKNLTFQYI